MRSDFMETREWNSSTSLSPLIRHSSSYAFPVRSSAEEREGTSSNALFILGIVARYLSTSCEALTITSCDNSLLSCRWVRSVKKGWSLSILTLSVLFLSKISDRYIFSRQSTNPQKTPSSPSLAYITTSLPERDRPHSCPTAPAAHCRPPIPPEK